MLLLLLAPFQVFLLKVSILQEPIGIVSLALQTKMSPSLEESVNTYELSPDQRRILYETSTTLHDHDSALDVSKEALLEEHSRNLKLLKSSKPLIKELVLPIAYSPSQTPLDSLQKVCIAA